MNGGLSAVVERGLAAIVEGGLNADERGVHAAAPFKARFRLEERGRLVRNANNCAQLESPLKQSDPYSKAHFRFSFSGSFKNITIVPIPKY